MLNGRTRGAIAGTALAVGILTAGVWDSAPSTAPQAKACYVFSGKAGYLPCHVPSHPEDRVIQKVVGTTITGCAIGLISGGFAGAGYGCLGGLASNIPW